MKCEESVELLSEYYEQVLDDTVRVQVHTHLAECPPCAAVMQEIVIIVQSARDLRDTDVLQFPDENAVWQRMSLTHQARH